MNYTGQTALITGGGSGIGYSFAEILTSMNVKCILTGSNSEKLMLAQKKLSRGVIATITADLSKSGAAAYIRKETAKENEQISLLVNNAGTGLHGPFTSLPEDEISDTFMVNTISAIKLTKALLPDMLQRGTGRVINVVSTAAFRPGPDFSVYNASKAGLYTFSLSLAAQLHGTGVSITALCPGPTRTCFYERTGRNKISPDKLVRMYDPKNVALCGLQAAWKRKPVVIVGKVNEIAARISGYFPPSVLIYVMRTIRNMRNRNG